MLLRPKYANRYSRIEWKQGRHLRKHLFRTRQRTFWPALDGLPPLRGESQGLLDAHNGFARAAWFRALAGNLCRELGAKPPHFIPPNPVYFLTITDRRQIVYPDYDEDDAKRPSPSLPEIRKSYGNLLRGLNYIGMLDPALYVSTLRTHNVSQFVLYHVHAVVWGVGQDELDAICKTTRKKIKALLPYATPVHYDQITRGTLLKVISYTTKMPRHQYQIWKRPNTKSYQQYKRKLNGVNSVRLYGVMKEITLDQLVISGGTGERILKHMFRDLREWRLEH